jgi:diguanylate cyclase (GGDEF)-like protein/PAS domain S-box-containing protein
MFRTCVHKDVAASLETIGAAFAIFESKQRKPGNMTLVSANSRFEEITKRPIIDCIGLSLVDIFLRYVEKQMRGSFSLCLATQESQETEVLFEHEGRSQWWHFLVSPILADDRGNQRMIVTMIDITEKKVLEHELEVARQRYAALVETSYDGIITIDHNQMITMMNEAALDIFGITGETAVGDNLQRLIPQRFRDKHPQYIESFRNSAINVRPMNLRSPVFGLREDGTEIPVEVTISKIKVGSEIEMTAVIRDISELTKLVEQLTQAATHDPLTGIFNRGHGITILNKEIHRSQRFSHALTVGMCDLDHLKSINDTYGHNSGDIMLNTFVATILKTLRNTDAFCRWGGDEFLVVFPETKLDDALHWAERARDAVASQTLLGFGEQSITITASFGLAALASKDLMPEDLIKRADEALYHAKESGRNQVAVAPG